jgi:O-antigen ligase
MAICIFVNSEIVEESHLYLSHVATVVLFVLSAIFWIATRGHKWLREFVHRSVRLLIHGRIQWLHLRRLAILLSVFAFIGWRIATTLDNPFIVGDISKLVVLALGIASYAIIDPDRSSLRLIAWLLPAMVALAIAIRVVELTLTNGIFAGNRLELDSMGQGAIGLGYICGTMTAFVLYGFECIQRQWLKVIWFLVGWTLLFGVVLSFGRNAMFAAGIITLVHTRFTRQRAFWKVALVVGIVAVIFALANVTIDTYTVAERFSNTSSLSGRNYIWGTYAEMATRDSSTLMLGTGVGSYRPMNVFDGGDMRDPHNVYLDVIAMFGITGLIIYLALLRRVYDGLKARNDSKERTLLLGLFIAYVLTEMFDTHWRQSALLWYTAYLIHLVSGTAFGETVQRSKLAKAFSALLFGSNHEVQHNAAET